MNYLCLNNHSLSIKAAAPIPVPIHIETIAFLAPVLFISGRRVAICLEPKIKYKYTSTTKRMSKSNSSTFWIKFVFWNF